MFCDVAGERTLEHHTHTNTHTLTHTGQASAYIAGNMGHWLRRGNHELPCLDHSFENGVIEESDSKLQDSAGCA